MSERSWWHDPWWLGVGAIVVTLSVGTCSTNARIDDGNASIDDVGADMNRRFDDVNASIDDVQADIRELRGLVIDALKGPTRPR